MEGRFVVVVYYSSGCLHEEEGVNGEDYHSEFPHLSVKKKLQNFSGVPQQVHGPGLGDNEGFAENKHESVSIH